MSFEGQIEITTTDGASISLEVDRIDSFWRKDAAAETGSAVTQILYIDETVQDGEVRRVETSLSLDEVQQRISAANPNIKFITLHRAFAKEDNRVITGRTSRLMLCIVRLLNNNEAYFREVPSYEHRSNRVSVYPYKSCKIVICKDEEIPLTDTTRQILDYLNDAFAEEGGFHLVTRPLSVGCAE